MMLAVALAVSVVREGEPPPGPTGTACEPLGIRTWGATRRAAPLSQRLIYGWSVSCSFPCSWSVGQWGCHCLGPRQARSPAQLHRCGGGRLQRMRLPPGHAWLRLAPRTHHPLSWRALALAPNASDPHVPGSAAGDGPGRCRRRSRRGADRGGGAPVPQPAPRLHLPRHHGQPAHVGGGGPGCGALLLRPPPVPQPGRAGHGLGLRRHAGRQL